MTRHSVSRAPYMVVVSVLLVALGMAFCSATGLGQAPPAPTVTSLAITSGGSTVTSVASPAAITLTATVTAGGAAVTRGTVNFCEGAATTCVSGAVGTAQITPAGSAALVVVPGIGSHSYTAFFMGTQTTALSTSSVQPLTVTGKYASAAAISQSGTPGNYTLTATVNGAASAAPSGAVSFVDTSNGNAVLTTSALANALPSAFFTPTPNLATTSGNSAGITGDFNGDGIPDVAAGATLFLGNGDGTFRTGPTLPFYAGAGQTAVGDFNNDGKLDVASSSAVFLGDGAGNFTQVASTPALPKGDLVRAISVADFNSDGFLDVAALGYYGSVFIWLGQGDGTLVSGATVLAPPQSGGQDVSSFALQTGDFSGDGKADLAVLWDGDSGQVYPNNVNVSVYLGDGAGNFASPVSTTVATADQMSEFGGVAGAGDFNGDGKLDLAVALVSALSAPNAYLPECMVLLSTGDGSFSNDRPGIQFNSVGVLGTVELAIGNFSGTGQDVAFLWVPYLTNDGPGIGTVSSGLGATLPLVDPNTYGVTISSGDFNSDGKTDLFVQENSTVTTLSWGQAVTATAYNLAVLPAGSGAHAVTASYAGDATYQGGTSAATTLTAVQGTPTVALTASPTAAPYQSSVTFTATVTGAGLTPTGTVQFLKGASVLGTGTLNSSGVATYTTNALPVGTSNVTASYAGDTNYLSATSSPVSVAVGIAAATITLTPSATSATYGTNLTFTAKLTGSGAIPTGTVKFYNGAASIGSSTLTAGVASLSTGVLPVGTDSITAAYGGDASYSAVTSSAISIAVSKAAPAIAITPSATSATYGATLTFTATLTGGAATPTGTVTFYNGSTSFGSSTLTAGIASQSISNLAVGTDTITAAYAGDANYTSVTSSAIAIAVSKANSSVAITPSASSITIGSTETLTATITGSGGGGSSPAGTATFFYGSNSLGSSTVKNGVATFATAALPLGTDSLTASYAGDGNYNAATSPEISVTVLPAPGFTLNDPGGSAITLAPGATTGNSVTITIAPVSGFNGSVALTAAITKAPANATDPPTLSFGNTSPVTLSGTASATATLTITTTPASSAALHSPDLPKPNASHVGYALGAALAGGLLFLGIPARRRIWQRLPGVALLVLALGGLASCGGSSSGSKGTLNPGTTAGAYQITVTGTAGSVSSSQTISLTIQ